MPEPSEEDKAAAATAAAAAQAATDAASKAAADKAAQDALGDAGKRALDAERAAATAARAEAVAAKKELEDLKALQMTDQEKALSAAKAEGAAEVSAKFAQQVLLSEIRAAAAGKLADPADAVRLLDLTKFKVADDGTVDVTAITSAIDALVKSKPYLAGGKSSAGSGDQGARGGNAGDALTRDQLKEMTAQQISRLDPLKVQAAMSAK